MIDQLTNMPTTSIAGFEIPIRPGGATKTVGPVPHRQATEHATNALQDGLISSITAVDGITLAKRGGYVGRDLFGKGAPRWNAHVHYYPDGSHQDGSMHIAMPQAISAEIEAAGWGERHPAYPSMLMVYSPRNEAEIGTITNLVQLSYELAKRK